MSKSIELSFTPFLHPNGGLILTVPNKELDLPLTFSIHGEVMERKNEFHATLVGSFYGLKNTLMERNNITELEAIFHVHRAMVDALEGASLHIFPRDEVRFVQGEGEQASVILMCHVEGAEAFYADLFQRLDVQRDGYPPYHITIYTRANGESRDGIAVGSAAALQERTQVIPHTEISEDLLRRVQALAGKS